MRLAAVAAFGGNRATSAATRRSQANTEIEMSSRCARYLVPPCRSDGVATRAAEPSCPARPTLAVYAVSAFVSRRGSLLAKPRQLVQIRDRFAWIHLSQTRETVADRSRNGWTCLRVWFCGRLQQQLRLASNRCEAERNLGHSFWHCPDAVRHLKEGQRAPFGVGELVKPLDRKAGI